jgi:hypothetical protein
MELKRTHMLMRDRFIFKKKTEEKTTFEKPKSVQQQLQTSVTSVRVDSMYTEPVLLQLKFKLQFEKANK